MTLKNNQETNGKAGIKFILPDNFNYSCLEGCGLCCRDWEIRIDPETYEKLAKIDWPKISPKFAGKKLFLDLPGGLKDFERIGTKCIFLEEDNSCVIHKCLGYDSKSVTCKTFPLTFVKTPEGVNVRLSFVCPAIIKNTGAPLSGQMELIQNLFRAAESRCDSLSEPVFLDDETGLAWSEYALIETALVKLLSSRPDFENALKTGAKLLRYIRAKKKSGMPVADILKEAEQNSFPDSEIEPGALKRRLYFAVFAAQGLIRQYSKTALNRYSAVVKIARGKGKITLNGAETELEKLNGVKFDINDDGASSQIKRYINHLIFAKWHLMPVSVLNTQNSNLISGYSFLLITYALIRWYSKIFAAQRGRAKVEKGDVEKAVSFVEKNYVGHISRSAFFSSNKTFAQISNILITQEYFEDIII